jgi:RNA polymerase sigma-70 factor (ECF subfamily)
LTEAVSFAAYFLPPKMGLSETAIIASLKKGDETAFERVFKTHFNSLYNYAYTILKNESTAEEIVQQVFFKIWEKRESLPDETMLKAYLYRAVHNESLNTIKHQKVRAGYQMHAVSSTEQTLDNASGKVHMAELQQELHKAMNELPEQCRTIFQMSRFEEMKYKEIADELNISPKTVENQMGKALKILREKLAHFLPLIMYLFFNYKP